MKGARIWLVLFGIVLLSSILRADEELMKKYEPFLFFHKEDVYKEVFYPMDAEAYLKKCSLWEDQSLEEDQKHIDEGRIDLGLLGTFGKTRDDSDKFYLKFVEKYTPVSLFPANPSDYFWDYTLDAQNEYINSSSKYTYYYRQFIEPDYGYLVLQYWFFYAFNPWGVYPTGWNVHEGDWESITLFLHPVTKNPVYVAYSAHHDNGDKVRRKWDEIRKSGIHPNVFVALGSHANYFEPKFDILTEVLTGEKPALDRANGLGMIIGPLKPEGAYDWKEWEKRIVLEDETHSLPDWAKFFKGKWGMDAIIGEVGFDGPRFPLSQSDNEAVYNPAKWAGITEAPAPKSTAKIEIVDADSVWEAELIPSGNLDVLTQAVSPRIVVEYADSCSNWNLTGSNELNGMAKSVSPRVIVEYADSSFHQNLQKSEGIQGIAQTVTPRIIVEYADSSSQYNLQKSEDLGNVAEAVSPRIIIEYADSTFSKNLLHFSTSGSAGRTLSINSTEASPGMSTVVNLSITDAMGMAGGDILVKYDANLVAIGEIKGTDLISGMSLVVNKDKPGEIKIGMAGTNSIKSGNGALIDIGLTIKADAQPGTQILLTFVDAKIYDESGSIIPVNLENSTLKITKPAGIKGDVNNNGKVGSEDAILALRIATGLLTPTDSQRWAADINGDGNIGSNDAILILRRAAGLAAPSKEAVMNLSEQVTIKLPEIHGVAGESITVQLNVDDIDNLAGGDIYINYDSKVIRAVAVLSDSGALLADNIAQPGTVKIAFASTDRLNSKTLARIKFDILADDVSLLKLEIADLYQHNALPIDSRKLDGKFSSWAIPPEHSALLQNFPNPFNPDTWIPYQLKEGSEVTIRIFSISGNLIRELKLGYKSAGLYISRDRAAYWNGKDEQGEKVASGVYFYSIYASDYTSVRKLIVLK